MVATYSPQGFVVVVAVNDEASLELAERILYFITLLDGNEKTVILVANKADMVKSRVIKPLGNKMKYELLFSKPIKFSQNTFYCSRERSSQKIWSQISRDFHW